jgi:hypothetical protein
MVPERKNKPFLPSTDDRNISYPALSTDVCHILEPPIYQEAMRQNMQSAIVSGSRMCEGDEVPCKASENRVIPFQTDVEPSSTQTKIFQNGVPAI